MTGISLPPILRDVPLWRGMSRAELDNGYDNSGHVADSAAKLAGWAVRSAILRTAQPGLLDLAYGPRSRNRIDVFRCGVKDAPLFVFIHGGYWQRNSKEIFSCMAEGPLALGFDVALPGYTLGPETSLTGIVAEIAVALAWLKGNGPALEVARGPLIVGGWSAGGHLAALASAWTGVDAGLLISGIYDLEPIRLGVLNDKLGLTEEEVVRLSPIRLLDDARTPVTAITGGEELPELRRQTMYYVEARRAAGRPSKLQLIPGLNHFSILDELISPEGSVASALPNLLDRVRRQSQPPVEPI